MSNTSPDAAFMLIKSELLHSNTQFLFVIEYCSVSNKLLSHAHHFFQS